MISAQLFVKMVLDRWNGSIANLNKHLATLTDEQLQKEIVPGKNRGVYLLGHLIAVHDDIPVLLGMGERTWPALQQPFVNQADKVATEIPSIPELRTCWAQQCEALGELFEKITPEQWFEKHTAVSAEAFAKEPHRNKLNIIITRTSHLQYHTGQLILLN